MDPLMLSRLQFAAATYFHYLFVPLTLGLSILIAIMETRYVRTGDEEYRRMARFWGKPFLINFGIGIVTGITLEFQFGTNWSEYSRYVGDIFGSLLAIEATVAFFLESTFIAVWALGWKKLSPKAHAVTMWLVAGASNVSAVWILIANSWMQHPVGYAIRNGRAELTDFLAVITQKFALLTIFHTLTAAYVLAGFFVMGASAWHLLRKRDISFFTRSFRIALVFALIFSALVILEGHYHGSLVGKTQPAKMAAMESHWETQEKAPLYVLQVPRLSGEGNAVQAIPIPGFLSLLAHHDPGAEVTGLSDIPADERPPVFLTFVAFRGMVALGMIFLGLTLYGWWRRNRLEESPGYLKVMLYAIPLPYLANSLGWTVTEVGRQPWIVYGIQRTSEAVSPIAGFQVALSLVALTAVYTVLGIIAFSLMARAIGKGPEPADTASA
jgi:cytochrome d ubiquinol oxidase subunit I